MADQKPEAKEIPVKKGFKHLKKEKSVCANGQTYKTWVSDSVTTQLKLRDWLFLGGPKEPTRKEKEKTALEAAEKEKAALVKK